MMQEELVVVVASNDHVAVPHTAFIGNLSCIHEFLCCALLDQLTTSKQI